MRLPAEFDEYRVVRPLGRGGMGQVYLAHDTILDRPVAIKVIAARDPSLPARERFLLEARALARLQHPNVVAVFRVGDVDGRPYLVSEFVRGRSLEQLVVPVPWRQALRYGLELARGLAAAHRRGVLHRDLKPANAILADGGEVKLIDFGLAKLLDPVAAATAAAPAATPVVAPAPAPAVAPPPAAGLDATVPLPDGPPARPAAAPGPDAPPQAPTPTRVGDVLGTPRYMAPEVWSGEAASPRSDVWGLGALVYYLCAGCAPYSEEDGAALRAAITGRDAPALGTAVPGVDPGLAAVVARCLARDAGERFASAVELRDALEELLPESQAAGTPRGNPYRGLHPFEAEHRALFFGRAAEVREVLERLRAEPFVLVAGDSGVGKSSLCRAGVGPRVVEGALGDERTWTTATVVPGAHPVAALAAALAPCLGADEATVERELGAQPVDLARRVQRALGHGRGLLLLVDQLEELVTLSDPVAGALAAEALGRLVALAPGLRLLATVRGDFLTRLAALPGLAEHLTRAFHLLRPLPREGLRQAIVGPARASGVAYESEALVETLVDSAARARGGLPLLQFALAELWDARDAAQATIPARSLDAIGGVEGALARHADAVLAALLPARRQAARRLLLALVGADGLRRRRPVAELTANDPEASAALDSLVRGRLVVAREIDGAAAEVAHEALVRGWPTLRQWLDEDAGGRAVRERIATAAAEWERLGRARDVLWRDRQLAEAAGAPALPPREAAFIRASRGARRRRLVARVLLVAALPLCAGVVYGLVRLRAHRELERRVAAHLYEARQRLAEGHVLGGEVEALRRDALAHFDQGRKDPGEAAWARARARGVEWERAAARAGQALEAALMLDHARANARALLAELLLERAAAAERDGRATQRDELLDRLAAFDATGRLRARWLAPAVVHLRSAPAATVALERVAIRDGRRAAVPAGSLGTTPTTATLAPGSYVLVFAAPGHAPVRYPLLVARGARLEVAVPLLPDAAVPPGFVHVPAGAFVYGSASDDRFRQNFLKAAPAHEVRTAAFLIARTETTFGEWLDYLQALPPAERARRTPRAAMGLSGKLDLRPLPDGDWELMLRPATRSYRARRGEPIVYGQRARRQRQDWRRLPVAGISWEDALAYAAWLDRAGRVPGARPCSELEWERAARGADDRELPHGDRLVGDDANFDETYGRQPLGFGPDEVGSHPASRSPFGVDDLAGNVWEMVRQATSPGEPVLRGGAYYYGDITNYSTNREPVPPGARDIEIGFRVCASLPVAGSRTPARP